VGIEVTYGATGLCRATDTLDRDRSGGIFRPWSAVSTSDCELPA